METSREAEEWRPIAEFPGYEVSSLGRVRSWLPWPKHARNPVLPRLTRMQERKDDGYVSVPMVRRGKRCARYLHRLVLEAFVGPCPPGMEGRHLDGVRANCALWNLAWGTKLENAADRERHGNTLRGERNPRAKLTEPKVRSILKARGLHREIAAKYQIHKSLVSLIKTRKVWPHLTRSTRHAS